MLYSSLMLMLTFLNFYSRKYSANQKVGSFHYVHTTPFGNYSFVCVDATLTPGPKRPYNFFGILNQVGLCNISSWTILRSLKSAEFLKDYIPLLENVVQQTVNRK